MATSDRRPRCAGLALALCVLAPPARADTEVIAPGNEPLVADMLGQGAALPDGCALDDAAIERTFVRARYACAGGRTVVVELRHPADAATDAVKTAAFAIVPRSSIAPELLSSLRARIAEREPRWHWTSLPTTVGPPLDPTALPAAAGLTSAEASTFAAGAAAYRAGKFQDALASFRELARAHPRADVVAMLTASLVKAGLDREHVARWQAAADAAPGDSEAQLVAGLGTFYCGELRGRTRAEKSALYRRAIPYLERSRARDADEPRVLAALALSHFRLGEDAAAAPLVDRALAAAPDDPDVVLADAEIASRRDRARARQDLQRYAELAGAGAATSAERARATALLDALPQASAAAVAGTADPYAIFDAPAGPPAPAAPRARTRSSWLLALAALLLATFTGASALVVRGRRHRAA